VNGWSRADAAGCSEVMEDWEVGDHGVGASGVEEGVRAACARCGVSVSEACLVELGAEGSEDASEEHKEEGLAEQFPAGDG